MTDIINLNRARKKRKRAAKDAKAAENRVAFGRTKAERREADHARARRAAELDGTRLNAGKADHAQPAAQPAVRPAAPPAAPPGHESD